MNKEVLSKIAELSNYLDDRGHKEESHMLDHKLMSLAQSKTLTIGGKTYNSYNQVFNAWGQEFSFEELKTSLRKAKNDFSYNPSTSEEVVADLKEYFSVPQEQERPAGRIGEESSDKAVSQYEVYDPRYWVQRGRQALSDAQTDQPGYGRMSR